MTARWLEPIRDAGVEVGFAVAIRVVEPCELVAAEHEDDVVGHDEAERLVEAGRDATPADALQVGVEARDPPDISLDRADRRVAIREEVVAAKEHERAPRVVGWRRDRVDGVGAARAGRSGGGEHLRPLRHPSFDEVRERMALGWRDLANECTILHPRAVEIADVADRVGKNHPLAVAVEAVIGPRSRRQFRGDGLFAKRPGGRCRGEKPIASLPEREKSARPHGLELERVGIEAGGEFARVAEPHAHRPRDRPLVDCERPCLNRPLIAGIAAGVIPGRPGNAAKVAVRAAVEVGPGRKQKRHRIAAAKLDRLLRVGVIDAVFIYPQVAVGPLVGPQRLTRHVELARPVGEGLESGRAAKLEQIPDEVAPLLGRQGQGDIRRHERADVDPLLDIGGGDVMALSRRIDEDDCLRRILFDDALQHTAVGQSEGIRTIFRLHRPRGPVDRLDYLVRREALGDGREFGADCAPLPCHLVACRAAGRGHVEHARAAPRVAVGPRVDEHLRDELSGPLGSV